MGEKLPENPTESAFEVAGMFRNSFAKFIEFWENDILCDVVIKAGNKSIKCHRNVLACCSPYFQAMFTSPLAESQKSEITIGDIDEAVLEMLIRFAYTGKIVLNTSNAQALLHASSILQFDSLAKICCDFMTLQLHPSNCVGVRVHAHSLGQGELVSKADKYIKFNFSETSLEEEFLTINVQLLEELISSDELFVNNEVVVYESIMKWVKHDVDKRKEFLPHLLSMVHLPFLPMEYLRMYVDSDSLVRKNFECRDLVDEARHFQVWHCENSYLPRTHLPVNERTKPRKCYSGLIFCVGGRGMNGKPFHSVEVFNPYYNNWVKMKGMSTPRRHVGCISTNGKVYAVGGCDSLFHLSSAEVFDPVTNKWSNLAPMSTARRGFGLCAMGGPIYAVGGLDDRLFYSVVERYDIQADVWSSVASMNCARGGVAVAQLRGRMFAFGGNSGTASLNTCEVYDPHLNKWTFIAPMNQARAGAGAVVAQGFVYVLGGFENNVPLTSVERYDSETNEWEFVSSMKIGRGGVGSAALGGFIYAIGGHNSTHYLDSVEIYDVNQDSWITGPAISDYRAGAGVTTCSINSENMRVIFENNLHKKCTKKPDEVLAKT